MIDWAINNRSDILTAATNWNGTVQTQAIYISQCREKVMAYFPITWGKTLDR